MGVRREQSHYVPASMDTRFLCEWSRAMMSAKKKRQSNESEMEFNFLTPQ